MTFKFKPWMFKSGPQKRYFVIDMRLGHGDGKQIAEIRGHVKESTWGSTYQADYRVIDASGAVVARTRRLNDAKTWTNAHAAELMQTWRQQQGATS